MDLRHDIGTPSYDRPSPPGLNPSRPSAKPTYSQPRSGSEGDNMKLDRRAQLQREAEEMREALRAKERELAELER
jgi:GATA-binding protein, other eukaryote